VKESTNNLPMDETEEMVTKYNGVAKWLEGDRGNEVGMSILPKQAYVHCSGGKPSLR